MFARCETRDRLAYRGYSLDLRREMIAWRVVVTPGSVDLPILRKCTVFAAERDGALSEARRSVDRALD